MRAAALAKRQARAQAVGGGTVGASGAETLIPALIAIGSSFAGGGGGGGAAPSYGWKSISPSTRKWIKTPRPGPLYPPAWGPTAASLQFNPKTTVLDPIQRGVTRGTEILQQLARYAYMVQMIRSIFTGGAAPAYPTGSAPTLPAMPAPAPPVSYPPATPVPGTISVPSTGAINMPYPNISLPFAGPETGGTDWLGTLGTIVGTAGSLYNAWRSGSSSVPAVATNAAPTVNQPGVQLGPVTLQSPITSTIPQECLAMQQPWRVPTTSPIARPQLHFLVNPTNNAITAFAPVKFTGVRVYGSLGNMVRRRRRSCCTTRRRKR